jgi:hypothetical protein
MNKLQLEKFEKKIELIPFTDCHIWNGTCDAAGYGVFTVQGKRKYAHRISYELHKGEIPMGMIICHSCDVPSCVNPKHLTAGTHKENMRDMCKKGRHHWQVKARDIRKLNPSQIAQILDKYSPKTYTHASLAAEYNVGVKTIARILAKKGLAKPEEIPILGTKNSVYAISIYEAVVSYEKLNPSRSKSDPVLRAISRQFGVAKWIVKKFFNYKKKNSPKWDFFNKNANYLRFIQFNKDSLTYTQRTWILDYRDFFVFKFTGEVYRKDGIRHYTDKTGRNYIKDFQGTIHAPERIMYAGAKSHLYPLSYKTMKGRKIQFKDGNKNNLKVSNLFAKNHAWKEI